MVRKHAGGRARSALGAAVILAAAGTAGCGVFQTDPPTLSGMQHQITTGEQIGAATQAQAAQAEAARLRAGVAAGAQPFATDQTVTGDDVVAIGDSVMAASALALADAMPGIYIGAKPDREMPAGLAILRHLAATGRLRPVLVLGLGTNCLVTTSQLNQVLRILGPERRLVLINTYVPDSCRPPTARQAADPPGLSGPAPVRPRPSLGTQPGTVPGCAPLSPTWSAFRTRSPGSTAPRA
jgi:hypothetical protein